MREIRKKLVENQDKLIGINSNKKVRLIPEIETKGDYKYVK